MSEDAARGLTVGRPPGGRRLETPHEERRGTGPRPTDSPKMVFDPAEVFFQLAELQRVYLARAKDAQAVAEMPAKDALACAKTTTEMMSALQAGKLAAVDAATQWPRLERIER